MSNGLQTSAEVELRWLANDELDLLDPIFIEHGWTRLNKAHARARVAIDGNGKVLACLAVQLLPHVEPLWVSPELRGTGLAAALVNDVASLLTAVNPPILYLIADSPFSERLAKAHGMSKIECPVYARAGQG